MLEMLNETYGEVGAKEVGKVINEAYTKFEHKSLDESELSSWVAGEAMGYGVRAIDERHVDTAVKMAQLQALAINESNVSANVATFTSRLNTDKNCKCKDKLKCECKEIKEDITNTGTYVAVKWSNHIGKYLRDVFKDMPNLVNEDDFHSTLVYSRVEFNHIPSSKMFEAKFKNFRIFEDRRTLKKVLVMELESPDLTNRHNEIYRNNPKATYDFDSYIPHCTISYDVEDFDLSLLDTYQDIMDDFKFINGIEYTEFLDLNK